MQRARRHVRPGQIDCRVYWHERRVRAPEQFAGRSCDGSNDHSELALVPEKTGIGVPRILDTGSDRPFVRYSLDT